MSRLKSTCRAASSPAAEMPHNVTVNTAARIVTRMPNIPCLADAIGESIILTAVALKSIRAVLREVGELRQAPPVLRIEVDLSRLTPDTIY